MSKQVKTLGELSEAQVEQVKTVIADMTTSKYSTSKIYAAHNLVFDKNETPESCASCLKRRATALRDWFNDQEKPKAAKGTKDAVKKLGDAAASGKDVPEVKTGQPLTAVTNKAGEALNVALNYGTEGEYLGISDAEGFALKPGTYTLENGDTIAVQVGGKSTYKPNEDLT